MMFKEELKKYVETSGLVNMKEAGEGIYVLKYKKRVFYDNLWDKYLEHCRGTVVDKDFNLIAYPFQKIYNYGIEDRAPKFSELDTIVTAYRKVNGFMVSVSYWNGDVLVSTTGSTSGDFVAMAKEMMATHMPLTDWRMALGTADCLGMTFMFECVHPNDPHIVPEKSGMYILGYRENAWGSKVGHEPAVLAQLAEMFNCFETECYHLTVQDLTELAKAVNHEGFVFYDQHSVGAKIKSPHYLFNKFIAKIN
jgi:hypothetical protein